MSNTDIKSIVFDFLTSIEMYSEEDVYSKIAEGVAGFFFEDGQLQALYNEMHGYDMED